MRNWPILGLDSGLGGIFGSGSTWPGAALAWSARRWRAHRRAVRRWPTPGGSGGAARPGAPARGRLPALDARPGGTGRRTGRRTGGGTAGSTAVKGTAIRPVLTRSNARATTTRSARGGSRAQQHRRCLAMSRLTSSPCHGPQAPVSWLHRWHAATALISLNLNEARRRGGSTWPAHPSRGPAPGAPARDQLPALDLAAGLGRPGCQRWRCALLGGAVGPLAAPGRTWPSSPWGFREGGLGGTSFPKEVPPQIRHRSDSAIACLTYTCIPL
jgi:hypothetical protein